MKYFLYFDYGNESDHTRICGMSEYDTLEEAQKRADYLRNLDTNRFVRLRIIEGKEVS